MVLTVPQMLLGSEELAGMLADDPQRLRGVLFEMYDRYESA